MRRLYDPTVRGRSLEIAARLNVPRWVVNRRAAALGLSRPKDRPWSAEDEAYVEANFHHTSVKTLARKLDGRRRLCNFDSRAARAMHRPG